MAWSTVKNSNCSKQRISDEDLYSDDENPIISQIYKNDSIQNASWSIERNGAYLHQKVYYDESSSDEDNSFLPNLLKRYSYPSCSYNHSTSVKNRSLDEDTSALCPNINPRPSTSSCNLISICTGISHDSNSNLSQGLKSNNILCPSGSSSSLSPPIIIKVGKSLNPAPANAHSVRGSAKTLIEALNGSSPPINYDKETSALPSSSSGEKLVVAENNLIQNEAEITDSQRLNSNLPCNQESMIMQISNMELDSGSQSKNEKLPHFHSNNVSGNSGPLYNWQSTMTTVKERFAFLFNNEILSDVHFRVGRGDSSQRIPAHRFVLAVGSAVFDAMFFGKLCTQQEEIELPDVEPQAFLSLLRFLYSDEVQIGPEIVMTVLYTAKKYGVCALERHCVEYLKSNLSSDNAFMLLTQARLFDEPQLASLCLETIDKNTSDSLLADGFTDIDHNTLCMVLERDTLRIREAKLFQAVVRWSEAKCLSDGITVTGAHQRKVLGEALSLIRFPLMTIEEFAQGPAQSDILTDKEIVQLFLYFTVNPKPPVDFLDIPRCCMTGKEQTVCRFQQIEARWGYSGTSDRIRFIVDRRIFVVGFGMYGSIHGSSEYEITIQIIHTGTGKVCVSNDTSFISDGTMNTFRVMFKEPFEVLPNTNYTAYATLKGPDSHYGTKGVRKVSVECPSGDRVTFQFTYATGNNNGTSVEDGQIPEIIFYT